MVSELAMLPEMFCSQNDCACRPDTAVVNASKIPMTLPPTRSSTRRATAHDQRPHAAHLRASPVPSNSSQFFNDLLMQRYFARYGYADLRADLAGRPVRSCHATAP